MDGYFYIKSLVILKEMQEEKEVQIILPNPLNYSAQIKFDDFSQANISSSENIENNSYLNYTKVIEQLKEKVQVMLENVPEIWYDRVENELEFQNLFLIFY